MKSATKPTKTSTPSTTTALIVVGLIAVGFVIVGAMLLSQSKKDVNDFKSCQAAGGAVRTLYPEQCDFDGKTYTNTSQASPNQPNEDDNGNDNDGNNTKPADSKSYIGLTEMAALDKAKEQKTPARVVEREGEELAVTMDFVEERLNMYVKNGVVYKVSLDGDL